MWIEYENINEFLDSITEWEALMFEEINKHLLAIHEIMNKYDTNYKNFICIEGKDWDSRTMFQGDMDIVDYIINMKLHLSNN